MNITPVCSGCSTRDSSQFVDPGDGRSYCRTCVEAESPGLFQLASEGRPLSETVSRDEISGWHFFSSSLKYTFGFCLLLPGIPMLLSVRIGETTMETGLLVFAGVFGFMTIMMFAASFGREWQARKATPRTVTVNAGQLLIKSGEDTQSVPLKDLTWFEGNAGWDEVAAFTCVRRSILLNADGKYVSCGRSAEMLELWRAFLKLTRIPHRKPYGCLGGLAVVVVSSIVSGAVGYGLGCGLEQITGNPEGPLYLMTLGWLDGIFLSAAYLGHQSGLKQESPRVQRIGLTAFFGLMGLQVGFEAGNAFVAAVMCVVNAALAVAVLWLSSRHARTLRTA